ncbi:MAG: ABC transporter ATP-binding protein [Candidatus Helarchaeota archaeon]
MISVSNLVKCYENFRALDEISFTIPKGKITGFLGPNGAGKTTTIRILTGLLPKTSGELLLYDKLLEPRSRSWKFQIGVVPEISNAFLDFTPLKNLQFVSGLYGLSKQEAKKKISNLLNEFGLTTRAKIITKRLSKGEKQRLNLCLAMLHNPDIYFLDEPTTGLDIQSTQFIRNMIRNQVKEGKTIFLTTHNLIEANILCDKVLIIDHGKIIASGTPDELRKKFAPASKIKIELNQKIDKPDILNELNLDYQLDKTKNKIFFFSKTPFEDFSKIQKFVKDYNLPVSSIEIISASLEEIFLKIIGGQENEN